MFYLTIYILYKLASIVFSFTARKKLFYILSFSFGPFNHSHLLHFVLTNTNGDSGNYVNTSFMYIVWHKFRGSKQRTDWKGWKNGNILTAAGRLNCSLLLGNNTLSVRFKSSMFSNDVILLYLEISVILHEGIVCIVYKEN